MAAEEAEETDTQTVRSPGTPSGFPHGPPSRQETYETIETVHLPPPTIQQTRTVATVGSTIRKREEQRGFAAKVKKIWAKYGPDLDVPTVLMMGKGALPPTIAISMYQSTAVANEFTTLGYLMAIVSILGFAVMPRAKFMQTMLLNLIATCVASAMNLLMMYCAVKARQHTTHATATPPASATSSYTYNSSASAVSAIWLFFQVYFVNLMRAKYAPTLQFPSIIYTIFVVVASIYSPQFTTMTKAMAFSKRLLDVFLTGFALATGVSLFVLPLTSRKVVFKVMTGYIGALSGSLHAHSSYFQSLEMKDMFYRVSTGQSGDKQRQPEAQAVKKSVAAIQAMQGKLSVDLPFAKREIAWGYLGPDDLQEMARLLRGVMLPLSGLSSVVDIFERLSELNGWDEQNEESYEIGARDMERRRMVEDWNLVMRSVHEPFQSLIQTMDEGLEHVMLRLRLKKPPKKKKDGNSSSSENVDVEGKEDRSQPGEDGFADFLESRTEEFYACKQLALKEWCKRKGIDVPDDYFKRPSNYDIHDVRKDKGAEAYNRSQRSLYALLYIEYLLYSTSRAIVEFVRFADDRHKTGKLDSKHLIMPGYKRWKKWLVNFLKDRDGENNAENGMGDFNNVSIEINMGEAYKRRKDPEHLPPENLIERLGDRVRRIPRFLRSPESTFGFRVACATMSIAIVNYLHSTQLFFVRQRLLWAMIMVAISMVPTAGQSIFSFILRITGTVAAMCCSFIIWYIVDEHIPGIIVFYWLFASCGFYIVLKKPRFVIVGMISVVTLTMIIGYELEVEKVGPAVASSNGQPYYEIYKLGPYRLATVAGGLAVAFIWTFFPYPISEHSELRAKMGASLYLLANYYSIVHETFRCRIRGDEGDPRVKTSAGRRMTKARLKVFQKQLMLTTNLRAMADFQKWEVPIGGKFPREIYETILTCIENTNRYMALVAFASQTFANPEDASQTAWNNDFRRLISSVNLTSHEITSLLTLLSASITNGSPLPPYMQAPAPYRLSRRLEELDTDILSLRHVAEPGYAAFAVIQIATRCIIRDLEKLLKHIKELVGELDFSFHPVSTVESSRNNSVYPLSRRTTRTGADTGDDDDDEESDKED
ncbi:mfs transporter [Diplodia corticola]|uniref:Mfs transporter n=1 Tax=Diplodia corticola TaxID=236234 RepID=A0A1J9RRQ8_9PEZI|nr:mfs transporter [Diplodia corticola]OJD30580.1 mfs transporter [Diplodia corticola]